MSTALLQRAPSRYGTATDVSGQSLADVVARTFDALSAGASVPCPACGEEMRPAPFATGEGACAGCGTTLA